MDLHPADFDTTLRKLRKAQDFLSEAADDRRSACLWSSGKDSMLLLWLLRDVCHNPTVIFFREPWQPRRYEFAENIIRTENLFVVTPMPVRSAYQQNGDEYELQNFYEINGIALTCPTGIELKEPRALSDPRNPWTCGLEMGLRPTAPSCTLAPPPLDWFAGSKRHDSDPMLNGGGGVTVRRRALPGGGWLSFPLIDFRDQEVFRACEILGVPIDRERYERVQGIWHERPGRMKNVDYVHACVNCLDSRPGTPVTAYCPKVGEEIANEASIVPWTKPAVPAFQRQPPSRSASDQRGDADGS